MHAFASRYRVLWGALAILAGAALSLMRSRRPGALNTVWIEDAQNFLNDALIDTFRHNLFKSLNGYYHAGPRALAELVSLFPVSWEAALLATTAALITAGFGALAYVASGQFFDRWWLRLFVAAPVVLLPLARAQADNDVATLQFPGLYALFWLLLWKPASRAGQFTAVAATAFIALSSIIPIVLAPLAIWRIWKLRDWSVPVAYFGGLSFHLVGLALGKATRSNVCCPRYDPLWVAQEYVTTAVPRALFGERWTGGPGVDAAGLAVPAPVAWPLIVAAWVVVLGAIACAVSGLTRPHWALAGVAFAYSALFFASIANMGIVQPRYMVAPALLLYVALAALLRPQRGGRAVGRPEPAPTGAGGSTATHPATAWRGARSSHAWPALAVIAVLAVAVVANYRVDNGRTYTKPWDAIVRDARAACAADPARPSYVEPGKDTTWWRITIPCDRVS